MVTDGWYCCPTCGKKLIKIEPASILYNTPIYCRVCRVSWYPSIYEGKEIDGDTPFTKVNN